MKERREKERERRDEEEEEEDERERERRVPLLPAMDGGEMEKRRKKKG